MPVRKLKVSLLLFLCAFLFSSSPASSSEKSEAYLIGRDDILDVTVWQSPDLTKAVTVSSDGTIEYPLLGKLPAAGQTPQALEKLIKEKLAQGYVKNPQVSVSVKEYNSKKVLVFGEVMKPGLYKLKGEIPLLELLFMVGGTKPEAKRMTVIRSSQVTGDAIPSAVNPALAEDGQEEGANALEVDLIALLSKGDLSQNLMIHPGDTIYVSSGTGERYYVLGQVKQPGPYEWVQDITVLEAIKLAQGFTEKAAPHRIKVRKIRNGEQEEIKVNVAAIMKGKNKDDVVVKPGDTIVVPESWI